MEPEIRKLFGFASLCLSFGLLVIFLYLQFYTGRVIRPFLAGIPLAIFGIINGFFMMTGTKFGLSYDFWKRKVGGGYPLWFGAILEFYVDIFCVIVFCVYLAIFVAPSDVQRLFLLLVGNTTVCLLLYFRFRNRRTLESYSG
ncbi:MAG: hypothetical protein HXS52_09975 [Theionarchaea archaeon]|nr:hypothetical protein [Theionarchaea archaeon]MBU7038252.1 hypothetical protein [Theionarchaea archaeon]